MSTLRKRVAALEGTGDGLVLLLVSALPGEERETATYAGVTYTQTRHESGDQFRARVADEISHDRKRVIWVSELDAAL